MRSPSDLVVMILLIWVFANFETRIFEIPVMNSDFNALPVKPTDATSNLNSIFSCLLFSTEL